MVKKKVKKSKKQSINNKLDSILKAENNLLREEKLVEKKEELLAEEEKGVEDIKRSLNTESNDIQKLEKLEEEIRAEVGEHPLATVTLKDFTKGLVGAFIGLAIHYTFIYGVEISEKMTITRATLLFPLTFIVGLLFIYATGFRKVKDTKILMFMPLRLLVLYVCSLIMSILVLYIFYPSFGHNFEESYKMVAGVMLAAVVGACTADLLGKD
jgi:uncharacterized membrane protein